MSLCRPSGQLRGLADRRDCGERVEEELEDPPPPVGVDGARRAVAANSRWMSRELASARSAPLRLRASRAARRRRRVAARAGGARAGSSADELAGPAHQIVGGLMLGELRRAPRTATRRRRLRRRRAPRARRRRSRRSRCDDERRDQLLLGGVTAIEAADADADGGGERRHRRVDALAREQLARRVEDPLALGGASSAAQPASGMAIPVSYRNGHSGEMGAGTPHAAARR